MGNYSFPIICLVQYDAYTHHHMLQRNLSFEFPNHKFPASRVWKNSSDVLKFSDYYETCITNFHPFEGTSKNNSPSLLHDNYWDC